MSTVYVVMVLEDLTYSSIQDGETPVEQASFRGKQKVVGFLLEVGANPDLQDKVSAEQDSCLHANLNRDCDGLHSVKPTTEVNFQQVKYPFSTSIN